MKSESRVKASIVPWYLLCALLLLAIEQVSFAQAKQYKTGYKVPDIALPDTSGNTRRLSDENGKVLLIDFWASWCGPCRKANPELIRIYGQYRTRGFEIYGISVDRSPASWKRAIIADRIPWIQVNDNGQTGTDGTAGWDVRYIPTAILLGRDGKIIRINPTPGQLRSYLKRHLD